MKRFYARGSTSFYETEEGESGAEDADLEVESGFKEAPVAEEEERVVLRRSKRLWRSSGGRT